MYLMKDGKCEEELKRRHDEEKTLNDANIERKTLDKEALDGDLEGLHQLWLSMEAL